MIILSYKICSLSHVLSDDILSLNDVCSHIFFSLEPMLACNHISYFPIMSLILVGHGSKMILNADNYVVDIKCQ